MICNCAITQRSREPYERVVSRRGVMKIIETVTWFSDYWDISFLFIEKPDGSRIKVMPPKFEENTSYINKAVQQLLRI